MAMRDEVEHVDLPRPTNVPTLLLTGVCGAGKATIAAEIDDTLTGFGIPHAAVNLDALTWQWPVTSAWNDDLMFENLAAIWPNYSARGATRLVLASELRDASDLDRCRAAVPGAEITVCRLVAPQEMTIELLRERMP